MQRGLFCCVSSVKVLMYSRKYYAEKDGNALNSFSLRENEFIYFFGQRPKNFP